MRPAAGRLGLVAACFTPLIITRAGRAVVLYSSPDRNLTVPPGSIVEVPWSLQGAWGSFMGTPIAPNYFITAAHVGGSPEASFTFRGGNYTIDTSFGSGGEVQIAGSDLKIWKVAQTFPAYAPLYGTSGAASEPGKNIVAIGRGGSRCAEVRVNGVLKGWEWGALDGWQSWGENNVSDVVNVGPNFGSLLAFDFDAPGVTNEAALTGGDSGGGVFIRQGSEWQLAGINFSVDGPFSYTGEIDTGFNAAIFDARELYVPASEGWQLLGGPRPVPAAGYASRISTRINSIYSIIPSFPINQQVFVVEGSVDVGTVDASTSVTVGTSTSGATLRAKYVRGGTLTINGNSQVLLKPDGSDSAVSRLTKLNFGAPSVGKLDLNDNDLIVQSTEANRLTDFNAIINRIRMGRDAETRWSGNGISSSAAAADPDGVMGLAAILNDNGHGGALYTTFDGQAVDINSILIKYTYMGDLNLDDRVDADDFFLIDRGFSTAGLSGYYNGDIDYNGIIDVEDYGYIDVAYAIQFRQQGAEIALLNRPRLVPEPSMGMTFISLGAILTRRSRRRAKSGLTSLLR